MKESVKQKHIPIVLILILSFVMRFYNILIDGMSYFREGTWGMSAWRIIEGELPYRDFFHAHPPISPYLLTLMFVISGVGIIQARLFVIGVTTFLSYIIYLAGKRIDTRTGLLGSLIYALAPLSIRYGMVAVNDFVAVTFCIIGYYFLLSIFSRDKPNIITPEIAKISLILAGVFVGLGVLVKTLLVLFFIAFIIFLVLEGWISNIKARNQLENIFYFSLGFLGLVIPILTLFYAITGEAFIWQVFRQHIEKPTRPLLGRYHNIPIALEYLAENNIVFLIIFLISIPFAIRTSYGRGLLIGISILVGSIILVVPRQYPNYYQAAIPLMAMVSGFFPLSVPKSFRFRRTTLFTKETAKVVLVISLIIFVSLTTVSYPSLKESDKLAIEWLKSNTQADEYILSDNLNLNFHAERRSPFAEISIDRTRLGQLNGEMFIETCYEFDIQVVVSTGRLFEEYGTYEVFLEFLDENYRAIHVGHTIYLGPDFSSHLFGESVM